MFSSSLRVPLLAWLVLFFAAFTLSACGDTAGNAPPPQQNEDGGGADDDDGQDDGGQDDGGSDDDARSWSDEWQVTAGLGFNEDGTLATPEVTGSTVTVSEDGGTLTFKNSSPAGWTVVMSRAGGFTEPGFYEASDGGSGDLSVTIAGPSGSCTVDPARANAPGEFILAAQLTVHEAEGDTPKVDGQLFPDEDVPECAFLTSDPLNAMPGEVIAFQNVVR